MDILSNIEIIKMTNFTHTCIWCLEITTNEYLPMSLCKYMPRKNFSIQVMSRN